MMTKLASSFKTYLLNEQFKPSLFGLFINPFYFARKAIYDNIKYYSREIIGNTLDIGCGSKPYEELFDSVKYIGLDIRYSGHNHENSKIDIFYDGVSIPFNNNFFDSIVSFEVLEVVFDPDLFLKEANRVLKPGGVALFTVPFIWDEHEQPYDFARYSSYGLKYLFEKNGFTVLENRKYLCDLRLLALLTNAYIYKIVKKKIHSRLAYIFIIPFTSVFNVLGHLFYIFPKNSDLYFGNIFLLKK